MVLTADLKCKLMRQIYFLLAVIIVASCNSSQPETVIVPVNKPNYQLQEKMNWLLGSWVNTNEYGTMTESWSVKNDSTFSGLVTASGIYKDSLTDEIKNFTDTLEEISLEERNGVIYYIPAVKDQNMGLPVKFKLVAENDSMVQFNNPNHDFPQTITYKKLRHDSICGVISGDLNGSFVEEFFPFKKL